MRRDGIIGLLCMLAAGAVGAFLPIACDDASATTTRAAAASVEPISPRYEDIQHGVECYELPLATSLSCVKVR